MPAAPWPLPFRLRVDHVHDGDTIYGVLSADAGLGVSVTWGATGPLWAVRLYGINAPELGTPAGETSREWLQSLVHPGDTLRVDSYSWDKYGRRLDGIPYLATGDNLCSMAIAAGMAVAYAV